MDAAVPVTSQKLIDNHRQSKRYVVFRVNVSYAVLHVALLVICTSAYGA